jgi:hypothetical protein
MPNRKAEKQQIQQEKEARYLERVAQLPPFVGFPKISRLNRDIVITEKIDGTNAAIGIAEVDVPVASPFDDCGEKRLCVYAQSRTRILTPENDNFGFAAWVEKYRAELGACLGPGLHFGEWWGAGIQRSYGKLGKWFSLLNVERWRVIGAGVSDAILDLQDLGINIDVVPVLYRGPWCNVLGFTDPETGEFLDEPGNPRERYAPNFALDFLRRCGSQAASGFMKPEGIVIFHRASGTLLKATLVGDEKPKSSQEVS